VYTRVYREGRQPTHPPVLDRTPQERLPGAARDRGSAGCGRAGLENVGPVYDTNPGGNSFVIVPGAATPVRTPVIGPPVRSVLDSAAPARRRRGLHFP
jgi:hypothetical protein